VDDDLGIGYFGNPGLTVNERVLAAQVSILFVTIGASVLAALFAEIQDKRRLAEAALRASETQRYLIETERLAALALLWQIFSGGEFLGFPREDLRDS
jgi:hypothetical protein